MPKVKSKNCISIRPGYLYFGLFTLSLLATITLALVATTLGIIVSRLHLTNIRDTFENDRSNSFSDKIKIDELMKHLTKLQIIADQSQGTRAIGTQGFNDTLGYITDQLKRNTDLIIHHEYFTVPNAIIHRTPQLQSETNGVIAEYVYLTDFAHITFSPGAQFDSFVRLVSIPNLGCQDNDWLSVSPAETIVLVKRGECTFPEKTLLAEKYHAKGLLMYNDGAAPDRFQAIRNARSHMNATIPAFFLSYKLGMELLNKSANVGIKIQSTVSDAHGIGNICADTPTGDKTKTIVIGSHSDGVPDGSGINDNGSGSIGLLVLALNLARLFKSSSPKYNPYSYRVRFCWWGAEELGLLGSIYHVDRAASSSATIETGRLQDYLFYFNYDMVASPNSNFGILDSIAIPPGTPEVALVGTNLVTSLFQNWFDAQKFPWTRSGIGGGSDFVPFLQRGIASGGVNTGAGGIKSPSERDRYTLLLGANGSGIANAPYDSCYHQECDRITNVNPVAFETVIRAAAYAIEHMGRIENLERWLYPEGRIRNVTTFFDRHPIYDVSLF